MKGKKEVERKNKGKKKVERKNEDEEGSRNEE
jgi:hypothetical protein